MKEIKKVFINAPIFEIENFNEQIFAQLSTAIRKYNVEAVAPSLSDELMEDFTKDEAIKKLAIEMIGCDLVVTHGDWHEFQECVILNSIARFLGIEVVHYSRLHERLSLPNAISQ